MPQQIRMRTENQVSYVENGRRRIDLDRGMVYRELYLMLEAEVEVANGGTTTAAGNINPGDLWAVVKDINFILNSSDSIRQLSGEQLAWLNFFWYHSPPRCDTNLIGIAADGDATVRSVLVLPFWLPNAIKPIDTALDARLLSNVQLEITWGDAASIGSGTGFGFKSDPKIRLGTLESFGLDGPFNTFRLWNKPHNDVPASPNGFRIDLPVGHMYRAFMLNAKDDDGHDLPNAIDNIKLRSGTVTFADLNVRMARAAHFQRTSTREVLASGGGSVLPYFMSAESDLDAWLYFDLVTDGFMTEAIDTLGFSSFTMEVKTNQVIDSLSVVPSEIIPLRKAGR